MRICLVLVMALAAPGIARAQDVVDPTTDEAGVTVNLDALGAAPELKPAAPILKSTPANKAARTVPVPRHKPAFDVAAALATPVPEKSAAQPPVIIGTAPAQPQVPVTIVENFPVEMRGVPIDPYASRKSFNPVAGFTVISRVRFGQGDSQLPDAAHAVLDSLAQKLSESKERVRLAAFSGKTGDMSSQSRRLSLERARAVREYLVSKGVALDRVDVLPFGGAVDGNTDRVDVLTRGT